MSTQPSPAARETRWVAPRALITRANVRAVAEPDPELVASIRANGVIQPPIVYEDGADLILIAGHRRTAAAIAADLARIEVVVGPRLDEPGRLAAQVSENTNRAGLRAVEVADAVGQMALLGVPVGQIAQAAGLRKAQVEAARQVAAADQSVRAAIIAAPQLTLAQAAELTAWGEDPEATAELMAAAEEGEVAWAHTQAQLAAERERRAAQAVVEDSWKAKGYLIVSAGSGPAELPAGAAWVRDLAGDDGRPLGKPWYGVSEGHAACPDRAVVVSRWGDQDVSEVCLEPKRNGHTKAARGQGVRPAGERAEVIANNKLFKIAGGVRETHLAGFIRGGKFPAAMVDALHRHLVAHPGHLEPVYERRQFYALLDFPGSGVTRTETKGGRITTTNDQGVGANRAVGQLLAAVVDAAERDLARSTWRVADQGAAAYLSLLVAHTGYQLSEVEGKVMTAADPTWTPPRPERGQDPVGQVAGQAGRPRAKARTTTPAATAGTAKARPASPRPAAATAKGAGR